MDAHSPDFSRLAMRWLDQTASTEEGARLWSAVHTDPACAREFAALARFESLLEETVRQRAREQAWMTETAAIAKTAGELRAKLRPAWGTRQTRTVLQAAAVLTLLGLCAWWLWSAGSGVRLAGTRPPAPLRESSLLPPKNSRAGIPALVASSGDHANATEPSPASLLQRLDNFFLSSVAVDNLPLGQAMGVLHGQLLQLNRLDNPELKKLRVTVPAIAAGRKVTFRSGPMAFLKAVQALAALGGCDVTLDESTLALVLHAENYPQITEQRDIRALLEGRFTPQGRATLEEPGQLQTLLKDAAALGIAMIEPGSTAAPMTRGQWEALRLLVEARDQLARLPAPSLQFYFSDTAPENNTQNVVMDEEETRKFKQEKERRGLGPDLVIRPQVSPSIITTTGDPAQIPGNGQPMWLEAAGEVLNLMVNGPQPGAPAELVGTIALNGTYTGSMVTNGANLNVVGVGNALSFDVTGTVRLVRAEGMLGKLFVSNQALADSLTRMLAAGQLNHLGQVTIIVGSPEAP